MNVFMHGRNTCIPPNLQTYEKGLLAESFHDGLEQVSTRATFGVTGYTII